MIRDQASIIKKEITLRCCFLKKFKLSSGIELPFHTSSILNPHCKIMYRILTVFAKIRQFEVLIKAAINLANLTDAELILLFWLLDEDLSLTSGHFPRSNDELKAVAQVLKLCESSNSSYQIVKQKELDNNFLEKILGNVDLVLIHNDNLDKNITSSFTEFIKILEKKQKEVIWIETNSN